MQEAVGRFVPDGASACMGTALETLIPFAAGHELIRQRRRDPALVGPFLNLSPTEPEPMKITDP